MTENPLHQAILDWKGRNSGEDRLSDTTKGRILAHVRDRAPKRPLGTLFSPLPRLALAGALPVLVLSLLLGPVVFRGADAVPPQIMSHPTTVSVTKEGNNVVFLIANGTRVHQVSKSSDPNNFDAIPARTGLDGAFRDSLESGSTLVFYRID